MLTTYVLAFQGETRGYFESRFWVQIPPSTARAICYGLQIPAALGYLVFLAYSTGLVGEGRASRGALSSHGLVAWVSVFSAASVAWPILTKLHLDDGLSAAAPAASLVVAAIAATMMTAGAFEADLEWPAVLGVLMFSCVVVMADAVGWNAKLIYDSVHGGSAPLPPAL